MYWLIKCSDTVKDWLLLTVQRNIEQFCDMVVSMALLVFSMFEQHFKYLRLLEHNLGASYKQYICCYFFPRHFFISMLTAESQYTI